jgi:hypothetical protein
MHVDRSAFGAPLAHWRVRHMHQAARKKERFAKDGVRIGLGLRRHTLHFKKEQRICALLYLVA